VVIKARLWLSFVILVTLQALGPNQSHDFTSIVAQAMTSLNEIVSKDTTISRPFDDYTTPLAESVSFSASAL